MLIQTLSVCKLFSEDIHVFTQYKCRDCKEFGHIMHAAAFLLLYFKKPTYAVHFYLKITDLPDIIVHLYDLQQILHLTR